MRQNKWVTLTRDCDALLIPTAVPITVPSGTHVHIVQQLGGNFTLSVNGNLVRIDGKDADALGIDPETIIPPDESSHCTVADSPVDVKEVWAQLRTCYDPEIPVNIVDLGLIYTCEVQWKEYAKQNIVNIVMTLTAPGCGMGPVLTADVETKVRQIPNVTHVNVELVFDPPWCREMLSESARLELGLD